LYLIAESIAEFIDSISNLKPQDLTELLDGSEVEPSEVVKFANVYIKEIREEHLHYDPVEELKFFSDYMEKHGIVYDENDRLLRETSNSQ